ncbi:MAG: efflux RND transporter permease subunit [Thermoguttaceae bacterium]
MKSLVAWSIRNTPAMNTLAAAIIIVGILCFISVRREMFPNFELDIITVTVPYPGAVPEEVEEGICQKIEEQIQHLEGIKKVTAVAGEGVGSVILELESNVKDVQKLVNDIRGEVDRIPSFPQLAERPSVSQVTIRSPAMFIALLGPSTDDPGAELRLREVAEQLRDRFKGLSSVKSIDLAGVRNFQIDIEISEETLRKHDISLSDVARIVRAQNLEYPGGVIKTSSQEILVRGKDRRLTGDDIAKLPLVTSPDGAVLTIGDLAKIKDEFIDSTSISRADGRPAIMFNITKTTTEDVVKISQAIKKFMEEEANGFLPDGFELKIFVDFAVPVQDRFNLLMKNGLQGLVLVVLILAIFLDLKLAFWVSFGIPLSICGGVIYLYAANDSLNMISMFAFIMVLGILVDDAIIVGENIYHYRQKGMDTYSAALKGTVEVIPAVSVSVLTTIVAFVPLLFVPGVMGKFFSTVPKVVTVLLLLSLFESIFILSCHLGHDSKSRSNRNKSDNQDSDNQDDENSLLSNEWSENNHANSFKGVMSNKPIPALIVLGIWNFFAFPFSVLYQITLRINRVADSLVNFVANSIYSPIIRTFLKAPLLSLAPFVAVLIIFIGAFQGGWIPFVLFPQTDSMAISATVAFPDGTPPSASIAAMQQLEQGAEKVNEKYIAAGRKPPITLTLTNIGSTSVISSSHGGGGAADGGHRGSVTAKLADTSERDVNSKTVLDEWRDVSGTFPGADSVVFTSMGGGPGGNMIELVASSDKNSADSLKDFVKRVETQLATYPGVFDIANDSVPGKWEFQVRVKETAKALGITTNDLASLLRAAYYGDEVMRLQRGRHEVKLMVRYPESERNTLKGFDDIRVRRFGTETPLSELAEIEVQRGYSQIRRTDQKRSITVTADVDLAQNKPNQIIQDLKTAILPGILAEFPGIDVRWEGQQRQTDESFQGLMYGLVVSLFIIFILLTLEFRSYTQPIIILAIIPFSLIGAVVGHLVLGYTLTLMSLFGMVALVGVVINDSIVLIDFINKRIQNGESVLDVLPECGVRRLRPVFLTSITTIFGVAPLILERSFQAQFLVPMAISICFGLLFSTLVVLFIVPILYLLYYNVICSFDGQLPSNEK